MDIKNCFKSRLGEIVLKIRKERRITQAKLAEEAECGTRTISKIENGAEIPDLLTLFKLIDALHVDGYRSMQWLYEEYERYKENLECEKISATKNGEKMEDTEYIYDLIAERHIKDMFYPYKWGFFKKYKITTLFEFIIYMPLMDEALLWDSLERIAGACVNYEDYICEQFIRIVNKIPDSLAKRYADRQVYKLTHEEDPRSWDDFGEIYEEAQAYLDVIRHKKEKVDMFNRLLC